MAGKNGTAALADTDDDALDLGDLVSETKVVKILRDGKVVELEGFVYATAPVSVYALIAQAHDRYMSIVLDPATHELQRDAARWEYESRIAKALIGGLTHDEADRLGGDAKRLTRLLKSLGYPPPRDEADQGEAQAAESTTETSSRDSEASTAATTPTG